MIQNVASHDPNGEPKVTHRPMLCMVMRCQTEPLSVGVVKANTVFLQKLRSQDEALRFVIHPRKSRLC